MTHDGISFYERLFHIFKKNLFQLVSLTTIWLLKWKICCLAGWGEKEMMSKSRESRALYGVDLSGSIRSLLNFRKEPLFCSVDVIMVTHIGHKVNYRVGAWLEEKTSTQRCLGCMAWRHKALVLRLIGASTQQRVSLFGDKRLWKKEKFASSSVSICLPKWSGLMISLISAVRVWHVTRICSKCISSPPQQCSSSGGYLQWCGVFLRALAINKNDSMEAEITPPCVIIITLIVCDLWSLFEKVWVQLLKTLVDVLQTVVHSATTVCKLVIQAYFLCTHLDKSSFIAVGFDSLFLSCIMAVWN